MLSERLKKDTQEVHGRLEQGLDLFTKIKTLEDYKALLIKFYRFYLSVERNLVPFMSELGLSGREKLPDLVHDFNQIGITQDQLALIEAYPHPPQIQSLSQALGVLYVLEGSTLGAQVISKFLGSQLSLNSENGARYFNGYQQKTLKKWQSFKNVLNDHENSQDEVVKSALETFTTLEKCLS